MTNHTPGPWAWMQGSRGGIDLATPHSGRLIVMDFVRQGMQGAQPRFAVWKGIGEGQPRERLGGIMRTATQILDEHPEGLLDHPDVKLIVSAPAMLLALRLIELGLARIERSSEGFSEFCFNGLRHFMWLNDTPDWDALMHSVGWEKARAAIEKAAK